MGARCAAVHFETACWTAAMKIAVVIPNIIRPLAASSGASSRIRPSSTSTHSPFAVAPRKRCAICYARLANVFPSFCSSTTCSGVTRTAQRFSNRSCGSPRVPRCC